MRIRVHLLLLLPLLFSTCSKSTDTGEILTIEDLLVKNNEIGGWTYGEARWVARNISELTDIINGAADKHERHGFREAAHQDYVGTVGSEAAGIQITVFDHGTHENAEDMYNDPETDFSGAVPWAGPDSAGEEAHFDQSLASIRMSFYREKYYVLLDISKGSTEALSVLQVFAKSVDEKILANE